MSKHSASPLIDSLSHALQPLINESDPPVIVGIETGGYWVAEKLHQNLKPGTALCKLNISFYRDDFSQHGLHPTVNPSQISESLDGKTVILVDDVLYSGRTIRAAMNELFDYGRPNKIILAILIDRDGRDLPIQADYTAIKLHLTTNQYIEIEGPEPLTYRINTKQDD